MLKYISLRLVSVALLTVISVIGAAAQAHFHVTICHRTGSRTNPYIQISPDVEGVVNGHMDHEQTGNGLGGDIIPFFEFMGQTYSKNLDTDFGGGLLGRDILANGCRVEHHTPTPSPSTTPTPPTTPTPTVTPTPGQFSVEVLGCEPGQNVRRVRFIGQLFGLTFFLNGEMVVPDANGIVTVQPGQYHWEIFRNGELIAEGQVEVGPCGLILTPTPTTTPTPTPGITPSPTPPEVPEPQTIVLLATGLMFGLGVFAFRKIRG